MNNHIFKLKYPMNILLAALIVLLGIIAIAVVSIMQSKNQAETTRTVKLSTLHPTYASVDEMLSAPDIAFAGRAVVLDNGQVRSRTVPGAPAEAPPEVHTDYKLDVKSIIKGKNVPPQITLSVLGGSKEDTHYVYEGVPTLKQGDSIIVFTSLGDDDKYYPLAGSTAIAIRSENGNFVLGKETINTGDTTFTEQDIVKQ